MTPVSRLFLAPPHLSGCLFAGVYRDTRGAGLSDADRVNHFPASPLVSVSLLRSGELFLLAAGQDWRDAPNQPQLPRISVMPPSDLPLSSWAPGAVEATTFGIYPDAWQQLGGSADFADIPPSLLQAVEAFADLHDPDAGWAAFCDTLAGPWAAARPRSWHRATGIADWARALIVRAAMSGRGRSLRALERRLKRLGGQSRRKLDFYASVDNLHRVSRHHQGSPLAEIAVEAGYSDQSHMGRAVRRATGFSPAYLNHAIENEEAFWCYRLLGERF